MLVAVIRKTRLGRVPATQRYNRPCNSAISQHGIHIRPSVRSPCSSQPYATSSSSSAVRGGSQDPSSYCRDFVKKHDMDSFLTSQFFPRNLQTACFAIRAFYVCQSFSGSHVWTSKANLCRDKVELAMVQDTVSNPIIGKMRFQFWRDAVQSLIEVRRHSISWICTNSWLFSVDLRHDIQSP